MWKQLWNFSTSHVCVRVSITLWHLFGQLQAVRIVLCLSVKCVFWNSKLLGSEFQTNDPIFVNHYVINDDLIINWTKILVYIWNQCLLFIKLLSTLHKDVCGQKQLVWANMSILVYTRPHKVNSLFLVQPSFKNWPGNQDFYFKFYF